MKKAQISLEFMLIFGVMLILLAYSINNVTFTQNSQAVETLKIQVSLEAKSLANSISNTISQVYAQGPGSKATVYVTLKYLNDDEYLVKPFNLSGNPQIFITYLNGTYVGIIDTTNNTLVTSGTGKNTFWSQSLYRTNLMGSTGFTPSGTATYNGSTVNGLLITDPSQLPTNIVVVVEWIPGNGDTWTLNITTGELRINIDPGG
ncbi:MAG: class III signal peptide-containing protein [Thermococcus sp.]|uniref:class III signal peptide-containing protein n=1 Tax=Thermococcus sp. TaxID=35749 RepID=UPI001E0CC90D|nr:class III signal peptide-containing protein [Thermococcus sp.]MBO8175121.1 class III signal peptide-containing protein [Thermococcus sp.]